MSRRGGKLLVDQLVVHGTEIAFCVPGESYLEVLDGLYDAPLRLITCRHEGGAANMAEAYGKLTGRPGVCIVTRGPGATHASVGVHTAFQDSTPLILLVGQVASDQEEREAFQELDYRRMFGQMAKWVAQIDRTDRIPELIARAYATACSGRPGPVVLALPEDMLARSATQRTRSVSGREGHPGSGQIARCGPCSRRPSARWRSSGARTGRAASADMPTFLEANELPAGAAFRRQDALDNDSPSYVGDVGIGINPALAERVKQADVLLVVGPRLGEMTTSGYTLLEPPTPKQTLVHVHPGAEELGRVYQPELPILSGMEQFAAAVRELRVEPRWREWTRSARADYEAWQQHGPMPGPLDLGDCIAHLRDACRTPSSRTAPGTTPSGCTASGAGTAYPSQLAPTSGAMGYGVPAAVAAKALLPERTVICFAGDGDFLMTGQELATAVQYGLPIVVLVVDNGMYGTIRMHQERHFPGRVVGTDLVNPDFARLRSGLRRLRRERRAHRTVSGRRSNVRSRGAAVLLALRIDPEAITPRTTLSAIRPQRWKGAGREPTQAVARARAG